MLQNSKNTSS